VTLKSCNATGNIAGLNGGALFVDFGGNATLIDCKLSNNTAKLSGAAWFGFGRGQTLIFDKNTTFGNNIASCCYASGYGAKLINSRRQTCSDTDSGEGGSDCCYNTQYSDGAACMPCLHGGDCRQVGASLATQSVLPTYWRASEATTDIRKCWEPSACTGGGGVDQNVLAQNLSTPSLDRRLAGTDTSIAQAASKYCAAGHQGPCKSRVEQFIVAHRLRHASSIRISSLSLSSQSHHDRLCGLRPRLHRYPQQRLQ
jgi:hypothetical protein